MYIQDYKTKKYTARKQSTKTITNRTTQQDTVIFNYSFLSLSNNYNQTVA